ncbi:MAG: IclR family transcriptional regulator [Clostridiales bacterium]|jgi:DNA-binding IclR family transcriptional regulator|nr:IclR family transcriptional regulator [Clostridiales bacterium]
MEQSLQLIERVFAVLEYLSGAREAKGPSEIASFLSLPKSTVHRLLSSMLNLGYVEKTGSGTYRIGVKLVGIVSNHINSLELRTEARPVLTDLRAELGLAVYLGILDGFEVVYVEKLDIERNLRIYTQIGLRVPAYCSSLGKCLLSCLSGNELGYLLQNNRLRRFTQNTITDPAELKTCLRRVRTRGWAMDNSEYIPRSRCIGAPVYDYRGEMIAAVSASGPESLLSDERTESVADAVVRAGKEISRRLCFQENG